MQVDTSTERQVFAYGGSVSGEMFALIVYRCPSCGSTGKADSWCEGHSAPLECGDSALRIKREPVLVPHAEPDRSTTEIYDRPKPQNEKRCGGSGEINTFMRGMEGQRGGDPCPGCPDCQPQDEEER